MFQIIASFLFLERYFCDEIKNESLLSKKEKAKWIAL